MNVLTHGLQQVQQALNGCNYKHSQIYYKHTKMFAIRFNMFFKKSN